MGLPNPRESVERIRGCARASGVEIIGFAEIRELRNLLHHSIEGLAAELPHAISLGFRLSDVVIDSLVDGPTLIYKHQYKTANWILDQCAARVVRLLESGGSRALAIPASQTVDWERQLGHLSHKAVAHASGLGWIGKSNLLVNEEHGARLRFSTVLTDLPLPTGMRSGGGCGDCRRCIDICPAGAITDEKYEMDKCLAKLKEFAKRPGIGVYICGMCVQACPIRK